GENFGDFHAVRTILFPLIQGQPVTLKQFPDVASLPVEELIKSGNHDAEGVFTEHRAFGNARQLLIFRYGNRKSVMVIYMQHDVNIGTAIADIDHPIGGNTQSTLEFLHYRDLAIAGGHALDGTNFAGASVELEFGAVNAFRRHDAVERGNDDFARCF